AVSGLHGMVAPVMTLRVLAHPGVSLYRHREPRGRLEPPHDVHDVAAVRRAKLESDLAPKLAVPERRLRARRAFVRELERGGRSPRTERHCSHGRIGDFHTPAALWLDFTLGYT